MTDNLYDILGADKNADDVALAASYRQRAKECHPDKNPGDAKAIDRFKQLAIAYEVLSDPLRRRQYDKTGKIPRRKGDARREAAVTVVANLIHAVLRKDTERGVKTSQRQFTKDLEKSLSLGLVEIEKQLAQMEGQKANLEDVASRFDPPKGDQNVLEKIVLAPIQEIENDIARAKEAATAHKDAIKIVKSYGFRSAKGAREQTVTFSFGVHTS